MLEMKFDRKVCLIGIKGKSAVHIGKKAILKGNKMEIYRGKPVKKWSVLTHAYR